MEFRNDIKYEMRKLGSRSYTSDSYKIPNSDTWYSYGHPKALKREEDLDHEVTYLAGLIAELSAKKAYGAFECQFNKWKKILLEIPESKNPQRPIIAIQRRINKFRKINSLIVQEVETGINLLLERKNINSGIFYITMEDQFFKL